MKRALMAFSLVIGLWACTQHLGEDELDQVEHPNFSQHIAPIVLNHCVRCHRSGGGAPFELTSFAKVKNKAKTIAKVTSLRIMPPWPADPNYSHFVDENFLSQSQINLIQRWVKDGCPEGASSEKLFENIPQYRSNLGKPDLVLSLDTVLLSAGDLDRFFYSKASGHGRSTDGLHVSSVKLQGQSVLHIPTGKIRDQPLG